MIVLDAARDNPFVNALGRSMGSRSVTKGLAPIDPGADFIVLMSSSPGMVARVGSGRYSPFADAFAKNIASTDAEIHTVLRRIARDVQTATNGAQTPWYTTSLRGEYMLASRTPEPPPRLAGKRIALVIGIDEYEGLSPLANPVLDARAVAELLAQHRFKVLKYFNIERAKFLDALDEIKVQAEGAETAIVYYAGHGMEIKGTNMLLPRDAQLACQLKEVRRTVDLKLVFDAIETVPRKIVLLDACRNDPIPGCARSSDSGVGFRGFGQIRTPGLLLANSTLTGALAADGERGKHSPFAKALLGRLRSEPQSLFRDVFDRVAYDVAGSTNNFQVPEIITRGGAPLDCLSGLSCGLEQFPRDVGHRP